jgi:hypothetical protein
MVRYSLLRILIFFGCLAVFWLAGLRSAEQGPILVVLAGLSSMAISFFVLKPFREDASRAVAERIEKRQAAKQGRPTDEQLEDLEDSADASDSAEYR